MPRHRGRTNPGQGFLSFGSSGIAVNKVQPPSAGKPQFTLSRQIVGEEATKLAQKNNSGKKPNTSLKETKYTWLDATPTPGNHDKGRGIWYRFEKYQQHIGDNPTREQIRRFVAKCALEEFEAQTGRKPTPKEKSAYLRAIMTFVYKDPAKEFLKHMAPF